MWSENSAQGDFAHESTLEHLGAQSRNGGETHMASVPVPMRPTPQRILYNAIDTQRQNGSAGCVCARCGSKMGRALPTYMTWMARTSHNRERHTERDNRERHGGRVAGVATHYLLRLHLRQLQQRRWGKTIQWRHPLSFGRHFRLHRDRPTCRMMGGLRHRRWIASL